MKAMQHLLLRIPCAFLIGWMAFTVGFVRLVVMSTRLTTEVIRGESPDRAILGLRRDPRDGPHTTRSS